jgi:hypothetical protein
VNNCGACAHVCTGVNATVVCAAGICGFVCESGFGDCSNDPVGCETNLSSDVNNCGACGHVCNGANTTMACADGTCVHGPCEAGWADCDGIASNGCETNIGTDINNCGACHHVCRQGQTCVAGVCT